MKVKNKKNAQILLLVLIIFSSFFIRAYNSGNVFPSNDHIDPVMIAIKLNSMEFNFDSITKLNTENFFARLLIHPVGIAHIDLTYLWSLLVFKILGISINEFMWVLPFILFGVLCVIATFLVVKELTNQNAALLSAAFVAVLPTHVSHSRMIGVGIVIAISLQLLSLYFYTKYLSTDCKRYAWLGSFVLGIYMLSNSLFPAMFVVIFYLFMVFSSQTGFIKKAKYALKGVLRLQVYLIPLIVLVSLLIMHIIIVRITSVSCYDLIGHTFSGGKNSLGFYITSFIEYSFNGVGPIFFALMIIITFFGVKETIQSSKGSILFVFGVIYLLPFLFLVPPGVTQVYSYMIHGLTMLVIYLAMVISRLNTKSVFMAWFKYCLISLILICSVITTLNKLDSINLIPLLNVNQKGYGTVFPDSGAKAAGYWIRENTPEDFAVFSDATGGGGIEPYIGQYYFNRKILGINDATPEESLDLLDKNKGEIDILVISPKNDVAIKDIIKEAKFYKVLEIWDNDQQVLFVYSKIESPLKIAQLREYNNLFGNNYKNIEDFTNKGFLSEEKEKMPYFIDKCSNTPLARFYRKIGLIKN